MEKGHVPHGQDVISGQINCNCEYLLEYANFLCSSFILECTVAVSFFMRDKKKFATCGQAEHLYSSLSLHHCIEEGFGVYIQTGLKYMDRFMKTFLRQWYKNIASKNTLCIHLI